MAAVVLLIAVASRQLARATPHAAASVLACSRVFTADAPVAPVFARVPAKVFARAFARVPAKVALVCWSDFARVAAVVQPLAVVTPFAIHAAPTHAASQLATPHAVAPPWLKVAKKQLKLKLLLQKPLSKSQAQQRTCSPVHLEPAAVSYRESR